MSITEWSLCSNKKYDFGYSQSYGFFPVDPLAATFAASTSSTATARTFTGSAFFFFPKPNSDAFNDARAPPIVDFASAPPPSPASAPLPSNELGVAGRCGFATLMAVGTTSNFGSHLPWMMLWRKALKPSCM